MGIEFKKACFERVRFSICPDFLNKSIVVKVAMSMTAVGFEPTQLALVELESTPLDHSGKLS